ncbi:Antibiotic biosynthesis monooxygenase [Serratia sp. AS12]|nr:Antibiotic biosynthesis monooxygenase [Serratia plymuthica AS9]AEF51941.1 Antibiotic biosynthesis monooxygenase [Serratia sp. AS12]AEG29648.1 Antibiotic biosynthesis monooxygenase [Serratia sp. AS13]
MNIFELGIKAGKSRQYDEVARSTISSSLEAESGTLAMYSLKRKDDLNQAYMIEIYAGKEAYKKHVDSEQYKAFIERAPEIIDQKSKTDVTPQFLGDKQIVQNERTINNLVIVDVKPEHQQAFKNIVLAEMSDSLKIEDGVLAMYAATDAKNENRWYFYEIYASEADYQRHRQTPHFRGYIAQTSEMTTAKESIPVVPVFLRNKGAMQFDD